MLVRSESILRDASSLHSDTRSKPGILTPASDGSANSASNTKKRKRGELPPDHGVEELLGESFSVKPYPCSSYDKSRTLKPLAILSRSDLPLAWLDRSRPSSTSLPESRLYEASIKILDLEQRMSSTPSVLIALLDDKKSVYAIEYDSRERYVFFKLGSWVDLNKIYSVAVVSRSTSRPQSRAASVSTRGDDVFVDRTSQFEAQKFSKKKKLAIEAIQSMVRRPSAAATPQAEAFTIPNPLKAGTILEPALAADRPESYIPASQEVLEVQPEPTSTEVLENIRSQYLENLYLSKASTAYFAKGPLSRARATYQLDIDSTFDMKELIDFLKSLVLPTAALDKKYKDGVTEAVSKIESGGGSDVGMPGKAPRKKRAAKKIKLAKNGLYTNEDALIQQWWENYDSSTEVPGTSRESVTRSRISQLRIRETQLQMIVILESLQLDKMAPPPEADIGGGLPVPEMKTEPKDEKQVKTKAKKAQDLTALVNIHVDRLAIWQSISAEESKGAVKSVEVVDEADKPTGVTDKHAADILRDFCVEVIVPFFSARLPSICDTICRKLGGPKIIPSTRPPVKKSATVAKPTSRPGAATKRAPPRESAVATLERLLTEDRAQSRPGSRGPSRAISLMRSATMPGMKRERSETPTLSRIPSFDSQGITATRAGVQNSRKFTQREVDMSFASLIDPALKKANLNDELKDAISALKRPNRSLAGQSMAELSEKRTAAAASQSRKAKKPIRNALFDGGRSQGVQIQATPRATRHKDMITEPQLPRTYGGGHGHDFEPEPSVIPPSSISRVQSSGSRLGGGPRADEPPVLTATPLKRRLQPDSQRMENTPTRKPSFSRSTFEQSVSATPARAPSFSQSMNAGFQAASILDTVADTPVRPSSNRTLFGDLNNSRSAAPPSPSPPKRQSTVKEFMGPPVLSGRDNVFETPQKTKATSLEVPKTPDVNTVPLKPLDFGRRKSMAVPESPAATIQARIEEAAAPPSSSGEDIYAALGWDDDDDL